MAEFENNFKGATETGECRFTQTLDEEFEICFAGGTNPRSERWLVCKTVRLNENMFKLMNDSNSDFADLIPLAGVAVRLDQSAPTNGTVSCTLPLPIESGLPVQVCPCLADNCCYCCSFFVLIIQTYLRSMDGSSCVQIDVRLCTSLAAPIWMDKQWTRRHGIKN